MSGISLQSGRRRTPPHSGAAWSLPAYISSGDPSEFHRARLVGMFSWTLVLVASIYAIIFYLMGCTVGAAGLVMGVGLSWACVVSMRMGGSSFVTGNLLTASFFCVVTVLACRLGGHGSPAHPWYVAVPIMALCTAGRRSAIVWLVVALSSLSLFYVLDRAGHVFPNDVAAHLYGLLAVLGWTGLTLLVFALAVLFDVFKERTFAQLKAAESELRKAKESAEAANSAKSMFLANM